MNPGNVEGNGEIPPRRFQGGNPAGQGVVQFVLPAGRRVARVVGQGLAEAAQSAWRGARTMIVRRITVIRTIIERVARIIVEGVVQAIANGVISPAVLMLESMVIQAVVFKALKILPVVLKTVLKFLLAVVSEILPESMVVPMILKAVAWVVVLAVIMLVVQKAWRAMPAAVFMVITLAVAQAIGGFPVVVLMLITLRVIRAIVPVI
ncbi:MAG: hypothetical protein LBF49_00015 [Puniceicoccales bacterium]|jgi:hypothetical protein|nr:hypothetical protein [Puniceicoccales bacterium]